MLIQKWQFWGGVGIGAILLLDFIGGHLGFAWETLTSWQALAINPHHASILGSYTVSVSILNLTVVVIALVIGLKLWKVIKESEVKQIKK